MTQIRPTVSVCIATYNQRPYIADCLHSALMQRHDVDLEILVGDDDSTDGTADVVAEIAAAHPGIVRLIRHRPNVGPARNYQQLIAEARGAYVAHLDGDDFWLPGKLRTQLRFLARHPACVAVYGNAVAVDRGGCILGAFNNEQPSTVDLTYLLRRGNYLNLSSLLYRATLKPLITEIPGEFIDYRIHLRLAKRGRLGYVNRALVGYRVGSATSMILRMPDKVRELYWDALREAEGCAGVIDARACFWADVLHARGLATAWEWASRIRREYPEDATKILLRGAVHAARLLHVRASDKISRIINRTELRVLHQR